MIAELTPLQRAILEKHIVLKNIDFEDDGEPQYWVELTVGVQGFKVTPECMDKETATFVATRLAIALANLHLGLGVNFLNL